MSTTINNEEYSSHGTMGFIATESAACSLMASVINNDSLGTTFVKTALGATASVVNALVIHRLAKNLFPGNLFLQLNVLFVGNRLLQMGLSKMTNTCPTESAYAFILQAALGIQSDLLGIVY